MYRDERIIYFREIDVLMQEEFTQEEKLYVTRILKLLGVHMVLSNDMLFKFYKLTFGEDLKLKFVKLAVKNKLIIEYQRNSTGISVEETFFFELKKSGVYALKEGGGIFLPVGYFWTNKERNGVIEYNRRLLEKNINQLKRFEIALDLFNKGYDEYSFKCLRDELINAKNIQTSNDYFGFYTKALMP